MQDPTDNLSSGAASLADSTDEHANPSCGHIPSLQTKATFLYLLGLPCRRAFPRGSWVFQAGTAGSS